MRISASRLGTVFKFLCILVMVIPILVGCGGGGGSSNSSHQDMQNYLGDPQYPDDFWQTSAPENEGLDSTELSKAIDYLRGHNVHSFLIIKNGKIVLERYGFDNGSLETWEKSFPYSDAPQQTPNVKHHMWSTTKTFTSALIGIAITEGKLPSVSTHVMDYFRDDSIDNLSEQKSSMTIENLLTMQSGISFNDSTNWDRFFSGNSSLAALNTPMASAPGTVFFYTSGNSQILSEIIRRATGETPLQYAQKKLFNKIGITNVRWESDPSGTQYGGFGLYLRPRDLARFGYLYLNLGKWKGETVVPEEWVRESTRKHVQENDGWFYGYHCWIPPYGGYSTMGIKGQQMYVIPEKNLVVVFTGNTDIALLKTAMRNYILPACQN